MAILAISLVLDHSKNDSQVERYRGKKEAPRHLRIIDAERPAFRTMNRLFQNRRMIVIHGAHSLVPIVLSHLDPIRHARRAEKQKALEKLVVVRARVNVAVAEEAFKNSTVLDILKNGHAHPWLILVRIHT